jgi:hypothetical protein
MKIPSTGWTCLPRERGAVSLGEALLWHFHDHECGCFCFILLSNESSEPARADVKNSAGQANATEFGP